VPTLRSASRGERGTGRPVATLARVAADIAPDPRDLDDTHRVLLTQGGYYVATGLLPLVWRRLFAALTGPKREWWLVETVGGVVTVIGAAVVAAAARREPPPEVLVAAAGTAAVLATIDVVYVAKGRIAPTYLVDAGTELGLIAAVALSRRRTTARSERVRRRS
jgi:hypothetical protein